MLEDARKIDMAIAPAPGATMLIIQDFFPWPQPDSDDRLKQFNAKLTGHAEYVASKRFQQEHSKADRTKVVISVMAIVSPSARMKAGTADQNRLADRARRAIERLRKQFQHKIDDMLRRDAKRRWGINESERLGLGEQLRVTAERSLEQLEQAVRDLGLERKAEQNDTFLLSREGKPTKGSGESTNNFTAR